MQLKMFTDAVLTRMERIRHELELGMVEHDGMTVLYRGNNSLGVERVGDGLYVIWAGGCGTYKRDVENTLKAMEEFQW